MSSLERQPPGPLKMGRALIVCPHCGYGFPSEEEDSGRYRCPRAQCGHQWEAGTTTAMLVHRPDRRAALPELNLIAGAVPQTLTLPEGETVIGRGPECLFLLDNLNVSRRHARVMRQGEQVWIEDLGTPWGTQLNGRPLKGKTPLAPCDQITIAGITIAYAVRYEASPEAQFLIDNTILFARKKDAAPEVQGAATDVIPLKPRLTFGRSTDRDVVLPDAMISARQAVLEREGGAWYLSDTQSRVGTFVNGKSITRARLEFGDRVQFGPFLFWFDGERLVRMLWPTSIELAASNLHQVAGRAVLLTDIGLRVRPGEFVGLLGPSGAGKSTLLDALNGLRPAAEGDVYLNGELLYDQYDRLRHHIGYVPQEDIIHRELTVQEALTYAGRLRLPPDLSAEELERLVEQTLEAVDLTDRANVRIGRLSGGQRKRASVGVELLSRPGVLFLDEPTSGLDPATESRLMRKFRQLANQGRTIVCTTHVMENVDLFDKIALLAPGGHLAYFGPPAQAKEYFAIEKFTLLYDRLEEKPPAEWQRLYAASELCTKHLGATTQGEAPAVPARRRRRLGGAPSWSALAQWSVLTRRYLRILFSDWQNPALMFGQPLFIAGLICLVCRDMPQILFLLVISTMWFGCSLAAQQVVKERPVYRRERMVNLRLDCYILSKFLPLAVISAGQCLLMLAIVALFKGQEGDLAIESGALVLTGWNGVALGLLISALSSNADKAVSVVPITLLPQIVLAGVLVPLPEMNVPTRAASALIVAKWSNQAMEIGLFQDRTIEEDWVKERPNIRPLWNLYDGEDLRTLQGQIEFLKEYQGTTIRQPRLLVLDLTVLGILVAAQLGGVALVLARQDPLNG